MTPDEKAAHRIGPGGYKCRCCGPAPRLRKKHRRLVRRRLAQRIAAQINTAIKEQEND